MTISSENDALRAPGAALLIAFVAMGPVRWVSILAADIERRHRPVPTAMGPDVEWEKSWKCVFTTLAVASIAGAVTAGAMLIFAALELLGVWT